MSEARQQSGWLVGWLDGYRLRCAIPPTSVALRDLIKIRKHHQRIRDGVEDLQISDSKDIKATYAATSRIDASGPQFLCNEYSPTLAIPITQLLPITPRQHTP